MFHMAALNGLSIREWTGLRVPFLPTFPMETWNFRIVHVAGALALGFFLFSGRTFPEEGARERRLAALASWAMLLPALMALAVAISFALEIRGGAMWNGMDAGIRFREVWLFGAPLWIATAGATLLSWLHRRDRAGYTPADLVLSVCGLAVAVYLITIYGTLMRNSTGTPFAPIGISMAAVAGSALIMELTRRVAGMALVVIAAVFLVYVFCGQYLPGFLNSPAISLAAVLQPGLYRRRHSRPDHRGLLDIHHPVHHLRGLPSGVEGGRLLRQLRLRAAPGRRAAARPRWRSSPRA